MSELKELIERHQSFCYCAGFSCSGCENNIEKLIRIGWDARQEEIEKRDELLEKAKIEMLSWCDRNECDADDIHEWFKQYEELKR